MSRKSKRKRSKNINPEEPESKLEQANTRSFNAPFFILGGGLTILGLLQTFRPVIFSSSGGFGRLGKPKFTSVYSQDQSSSFGILFFLMGIIVLYCGYCAVRNSKRKPPSSTDH